MLGFIQSLKCHYDIRKWKIDYINLMKKKKNKYLYIRIFKHYLKFKKIHFKYQNASLKTLLQ